MTPFTSDFFLTFVENNVNSGNCKFKPLISLPQGHQFNEHTLIRHILASGRDYIVQGQQICRFSEHSKPRSPDYWIREYFAANRDTKQAENQVMDDLAVTGHFSLATGLRCPDKGTSCKGLRLIKK